jgi:hypothetical protein
VYKRQREKGVLLLIYVIDKLLYKLRKDQLEVIQRLILMNQIGDIRQFLLNKEVVGIFEVFNHYFQRIFTQLLKGKPM